MKKQVAVLLGSLLAVAVGCGEGTPGGPGVKQTRTTTGTPSTTTTTVTANKPVIGEAEKTFSLNVPLLATSVRQGESKAVTISLSRGKNFDEDVSLEMSGMPQGITVEPGSVLIKHGAKDSSVTVHAANDAALGEFTIKVIGHPTQGADATGELKLTVTENK